LARLIVRVILTLVLVGMIVLGFGVDRYGDIVGHLSFHALAGACAAAVLCWALRLARWRLLASGSDSGLTWRQTAHSMLAGHTLSVEGHPWGARVRSAQALATGSRQGLAGLALLDCVLDAVVIVSVAAVNVFGVIAAAVLSVGAALFLSLIAHVRRLQWTSEGSLQRLARALDKTSSPGLLGAVGLTVAVYGITLLQFHLLLSAGGGGSWGSSARTFPLVLIASLLPVGITGIGLPEFVAALLLSSEGRGAEGVVATFGIFLLNRLAPCVIARTAGVTQVCSPSGAR